MDEFFLFCHFKLLDVRIIKKELTIVGQLGYILPGLRVHLLDEIAAAVHVHVSGL